MSHNHLIGRAQDPKWGNVAEVSIPRGLERIP